MGHGIVHIDLPEARKPLPDFLIREDTDAEQRLAFDILVECDLGTGQQANRNVRLSDRCKTSGNRVVEFRRHQLVLDLGRPVRDVVQTVVTHRRHSSSCEKPGFPRTPELASRFRPPDIAGFGAEESHLSAPEVRTNTCPVFRGRHWQPAEAAKVSRQSLRIEAGQRVIVVAGLPVHHYRAEDAVAEAYAMVFLVESGFAQQTDVARAFARSVRTVRRYQGRYAQGGMAALGREEGWRRGRRRIRGKRLRSIEMLKSQGMSNRAIAHRLGVSEKAIRKLVGPSKSAESAQLAFAGITTAAAGKPPAPRVPSAKSAGDDADRATPSAEDRAGDRDPITASE